MTIEELDKHFANIVATIIEIGDASEDKKMAGLALIGILCAKSLFIDLKRIADSIERQEILAAHREQCH